MKAASWSANAAAAWAADSKVKLEVSAMGSE
jgi:hypothetical protein